MSPQFEGKTLEEALEIAGQSLGVDRYRLTYHVVLEKRGFLGGIKRVVIEADVNEEDSQQAAAPRESDRVSEARPASQKSGPPRSRGRRGRGRDGSRGEGRGEPRGGSERGNRSATGNRGGRQRDPVRADETEIGETAVPAPEQGPQSAEAAAVAEWCGRLVELSNLQLDLRTFEDEQQISVRLYGRDRKRILEQNGSLMDSLQVITNKALVGRKIEKIIEFDCEEFKGKRSDDLGRQARNLADRVRVDGREQLLPAMTPIERRIVHLALQDDAQVTTESRGEGFYKRVAIIRRPPGADLQREP
jgi:spoIIIJ-associated protein